MDNVIKVHLVGSDYNASGVYDFDKKTIIIFKGSKIKSHLNDIIKEDFPDIIELRKRLYDENILTNNEFIEDYEFDDINVTTRLISSNDSSKEVWKLSNNSSLQKYENQLSHQKQFIEFYTSFKVDDLEEKIKAQAEVIKRFQSLYPLHKLPNLTLKEFDQRGSNESFMYLIEFGTREIASGFLGNNRNKLFFQNKDGTYDSINYFKNKYPNETVDERLSLFLNQLYEMIVNFDKNTYVNQPPRNINTIRGKLIMIYRPGELITFNSKNKYDALHKHLGLPYENLDSVELNIEMQKFLNKNEIKVNVTEAAEILEAYYQEYINYKNTNKVVGDTNNMNSISDDIFLSKEEINQILRLLQRKKSIIFTGPPGVGKTFIAKNLINKYFSDVAESSIEMVQFHQSYSYEEFIEGLKPQMDGSFSTEKGIFYNICKRAENDPEKDYFLIIDEINRGNTSNIFGELLLLLDSDKRSNYEIRLTYSKETFSIPENLYIIGTMNMADRSLSIIDYALRRRFAFFNIEPAFDKKKFEMHLCNVMNLTQKDINNIVSTMSNINSKIEKTIGIDFVIGHSYFIENDDIDDVKQWLEDIFEFEVMPLLREYYYDNNEKIKEFRYFIEELYEKYSD
ncbi:AAA family ATPase [Nosocomiicoccus ampullae]|uniref:MoxR-like ATPase n=1 Tax=Nosocomiicoccus ampullae TaxID=489910 RepID=A0A9Q2CXQ9_9STAP|nr:AAA family ATPase [Nosocomiicoccus ampullae]MBB5175504.1 MoxR-like ATPase [Nosocomiicoccus ampullae]QYA46911.1 AAA family ATPase [Nosocomiicoccus ampullae]